MFAFMGKTDTLKGLFIAIAVLSLVFSLNTCDMPMGLGDPIDWEPPVLTVIPTPPNPMYVRQGAVLAGTVTDNIGVDRVILREASTGQMLFTATLNGENWEIVMEFTEEQNNEKLAVEIVAYDRVGNSGDQSIAAVTLVIDIGPPIIEDIWIQRTEIKTASLEQYSELYDLERTDPRGERSANVNRYQNGFFTIAGNVAETETRIEIVSLNIYDVRDADTALLELGKNPDSTNFSPRWLISEEALLAKGEALWPGYSANYRNGERYYYRVAVTAYDKSDNESESLIRVEEEGFFCMWENADIPKGIIDPVVGISRPIIVTKGATLPVEFYDDDQLAWAYTGLLTIEQWNATSGIGIAPGGVTIPQGSDESKLQWLRDRLVNSGDVFNWRFDRYSDSAITNKITDQTEGRAIDEKIYYVETGKNDSDNGEYILFSFVADKKLDPHTNSGPYDTNKTRERLLFWPVNVIDENEPLIVFDTVDTTDSGYTPGNPSYDKHSGGGLEPLGAAYRTGSSPEENTFPSLTGGQYFTLNGYTLRANKGEVAAATRNYVKYFRIAWIPAALGNSRIAEVKEALQASGYPNTGQTRPNGTIGPTMNSLEAIGIQHWNFSWNALNPTANTASDPGNSQSAADRGKLLLGSNQNLAGDPNPQTGDIFTKQVFKKRFDILGGQDDIKTSPSNGNDYKNFTYNGVLENDTKLFIIYAEDDMGHVVFRELRLLGNRTPPEITIYDLTTEYMAFDEDYTQTSQPQLPDLNNSNAAHAGNGYYFFNTAGIIDNDGREAYRKKLLAYQAAAYTKMRAIAMTSNAITPDLQIADTNAAYPRDTYIKYWVTAKSNGALEIKNIQMRDVTFETTSLFNAGSYLGRTYTNVSQANPPSTNPNYPEYTAAAAPSYSNDLSLSFVERVSEVTQRVLLFTATDSLGNTVSIQRTIAVTNAAVLNNITTEEQDGSEHGIGKIITIHANFTNLVRWTGTSRPLLNVRYNRGATPGSPNGTAQIEQIPTKTPVDTPTLSLDFDLVVAEGDVGLVQSMYSDIPGVSFAAYPNSDRPITLPANTKILDASRGDDAFIPIHTPSYNWVNAGSGPAKSLQAKTITLRGIRPQLTSFVLNPPAGKRQYTLEEGNAGYYFRTDETIEFTLTSDKSIFTGAAAPVIRLYVGNETTPRNATWVRSGTSAGGQSGNQMVFSVLVNAANTPNDGAVTNIRLNSVENIVDSVGNAFAAGDTEYNAGINIFTGINTIRIDKTDPLAPPTFLSGTQITATAPTVTDYSTSPVLTITQTAAAAGEISAPVKTEYSLNNGVTWVEFPTIMAGWTSANSATALNILNGDWTLQTRFTDRAGNVSSPTTKAIHVNSLFPKLIAVTPVQPNGWIRSGRLDFKLDFDDTVRISADPQLVSITIRDRSASAGHTPANYATLTATAATTLASTITLSLDNVAAVNALKEMRNGLYVSEVIFTGLRDRFGNSGGTWTGAWNNSAPNITVSGANGSNASNCPNLDGGLKVDAVVPAVTARTPAIEGVSLYPATTGDRRNVITLTFSEPVVKGNGIITIKPEANSLIPPVFEDNGYYLNQFGGTNSDTEVKVTASNNMTTWIPGFYDIYNNAALIAADKNNLTSSTTTGSRDLNPATAANIPSSTQDDVTPSMSRLVMDQRTGQPVGPYVRTTQGLIEGAGYTGNYSGNNYNTGPNPAAGRMVPDTATKWVLAFRYGIHGTSASSAPYVTPAAAAAGTFTTFTDAQAKAVTDNISAVLKKAKFRWQEIDVILDNVTIVDNANGTSTVSIRLDEPLLKGLRWELSYPAGTFTDVAGNAAAAQAENTYIFWSAGVQKPVIRIDRKSYDARTANWKQPTTNNNAAGYTHSAPPNGVAPNEGLGWGLGDFTRIHYRVESETPGATIWYGLNTSANSITTAGTGAFNAVTGAWTGDVTNSGGTNFTAVTWQGLGTNAVNQWVRPNLINRGSGTGTANSYTVNGVTRTSTGNLRLLRSYNEDPLPATLSGLTVASGTNGQGWHRGIVEFTALEAGKRYVAAEARITNGGTPYTSNRGYEGVFRTVILLNALPGTTTANGADRVVVEGSNIKNGMPSIAGFPVQDAAETADSRFVKMMNNNGGNSQFTWVSTEIVSEWYFIYFGNAGSHMSAGEVNNYLTVGYGDLTYAYNVARSGAN